MQVVEVSNACDIFLSDVNVSVKSLAMSPWHELQGIFSFIPRTLR
jgi:hypothetical protein